MAPFYCNMKQEDFPSPKETHDKHFPDERFAIGVRFRTNSGHDSDNFIGGLPKNTPYMLISLSHGAYNSKTWNRMKEAFKNEGFETHLRMTSGTTRTRSGTCKHAPTSLYVW